MLTFFDYFHYRFTTLSRKAWHEADRMPELRSALAISVLQGLNVLGLLDIPDRIYGRQAVMAVVTKPVFLAIGAVFVVFNGYRYLKVIKLDMLEKRWQDESAFQRRLRGILLVIYVIVSVIVAVT